MLGLNGTAAGCASATLIDKSFACEPAKNNPVSVYGFESRGDTGLHDVRY